MPRYEYLPDIAIADVAFRAKGKTVEELFIAAGQATMNVMVDDLSTIENKEEVQVDLSEQALDMLLFDFLNELIFLKDARQLLLLVKTMKISAEASGFTLHAVLFGEQLDPVRHPLNADVKAVTLHRFEVKETSEGWEATVVLDI
jgi:SHS2 domain-containing protein